jgi:hypothetical protein
MAERQRGVHAAMLERLQEAQEVPLLQMIDMRREYTNFNTGSDSD